MNITVGGTTFGRNNGLRLGALLVGLTMVGTLAGVGIWQGTEWDSNPPVPPPLAAPSVEIPTSAAAKTYVYLADSQAEVDSIYLAQFESGAFNHNFSVIDISTPEGQAQYNLMNAELAQQYLENPAFDASLVQIIDMTAPPATTGVAPRVESQLAVPEASTAIATYFYVVDSPEQAEQAYQSELVSSQEAAQAGVELQPHEMVIIDMSTSEGLELFNTVNGGLFEMWDNPEFDQSLVQIIDLRR